MVRKILTFALCMLFTVAVLCACAPAEQDTAQSAAPEETQEAETTAPAQEETAEPEETAEQSAPADEVENTHSVTDMAGRAVEVPDTISTVFATSPVGSIYVYTLAPEKLLGWNYEFNDWELKYIQEQYRDLPVYGMNDSLNLEALIAAKPDIILQVGSLGEKAQEQADELSSQTGIPVLMYSLDLTSTPLVYTQLGELLGEVDRAQELVAYSTRVIEDAQTRTNDIPEDQRVTVYYGNGPQSLNTAPQGSDAAEVFELAGGVNCAAIELTEDTETERVDISPETLIAWNPDIIFVNGEPKDDLSAQSAADAILADPTYQSLQAVADGRVYGIPQTPFSWLDRPKGPNRIIGVLWTGALMYPDLYTDIDLTQEIQDFYNMFYHVDLTPEQVPQLASE